MFLEVVVYKKTNILFLYHMASKIDNYAKPCGDPA